MTRFTYDIVKSVEIVFVSCDIPKRNLSTLKVTIVSRSYDKLEIILCEIIRYFVNRASDFQSSRSMVMTHTHAQIMVKGQLVEKSGNRRTDGHDRLQFFLPR